MGFFAISYAYSAMVPRAITYAPPGSRCGIFMPIMFRYLAGLFLPNREEGPSGTPVPIPGPPPGSDPAPDPQPRPSPGPAPSPDTKVEEATNRRMGGGFFML
jgi:hypothetical protein